jgi:hypothetical protein
MNQNLIALSVNVARAYEIAKAGNHSASLIPSKDEYCQDMIDENCKSLRGFYGIGDSMNSDIVVELHKIGAQDILLSYSNRSETIGDINKRISECKESTDMPELKLTGANLSLLKAAIDKLNLSIRQTNSILAVSCTIAKLSKNKEVGPEHLAEAIQYQCAGK